MEKYNVFFLIAILLLSFGPVFASDGINDRAESFLLADESPICVSFEHYKMQDGWTPVVLSMGEFRCMLWMDASGRVSERMETDTPFVEPVCFIDASTKSLRKGADTLYFDVYQQNNVRTRWRLSPSGTAGTLTKKIPLEKKNGIDIYLGTFHLKLKHVYWDLEEFSPGLSHVRFHGPAVTGCRRWVYEKASGNLHSKREWNRRLPHKQNTTQGIKPGQPISRAISSQERAALIALYNSTNGDKWNYNEGWKTPPLAGDGFALPGTENTWHGITCDPGNTTVLSIDLQGMGLSGTLPSELGNLVNLCHLYLGHNNISGSIPSQLGNLVNLQTLYLEETNLNGSIPPGLGNMVSLQYLDLSLNNLSGNLPPELGNMVNLQYLNLIHNNLSGNIPPEIGNMVNLQDINLRFNNLSGSIPPGLGNMVNLQYLDLEDNNLSGSLPPELGNMTNLKELIIRRNQLSGYIPPELANIANLQYLDLSYNNLSDNLPKELGNMTNLEILYIVENKLSGAIPKELGNMTNLQDINLGGNLLSGSIPPELANMTNLQRLYLSSNNLSGSIPNESGNFTNLKSLCLNHNQLSGTIPPELGNMANLQQLFLYNNQLNGRIPPELGNMANLEVLLLDHNQLNGTIPPELGNLVNLQNLALNSNRLSGSIPNALANMTQLNNLDIRWNALYTNNNALREFLDSIQPGHNWEGTQTIAPSNVTAAPASKKSMRINWTPISYKSDTGGYRILYSTTAGGPYTFYGMTANKSESSLTVTGLNPGTTYYFVVQTMTNPHTDNQNILKSRYSAEISALMCYLALTSPNGGESWGIDTLQDITWTTAGLSGNIRLELWKADKKLSTIATDIPIINRKYTWAVGQKSVEPVPAGNDYKVKIITKNGLYSDISNAVFSIVKQ